MCLALQCFQKRQFAIYSDVQVAVDAGVAVKNDLLRLDRAELEDACVDVALNDTVPPDTTKSENNWRILADRLTVKNSDVAVHMPGDTLQVKVRLGQADVRNGSFDLGTGRYEVGSLDVKESSVKYDNRFAPRQKGLDYQHLDLTDVSFSIDSLTYQEPKLDMRLRHASMKEKSGLQIDKLSGYVKMDDKRLLIPGMKLSTPESELEMDLDMDMNTFSATTPGQLNGTIHAKLGKQDLMRFMGSMPVAFRKGYPNELLTISIFGDEYNGIQNRESDKRRCRIYRQEDQRNRAVRSGSG